MLIAALSGSLRTGSSNRSLLRAAQQAAPPGVDVVLYEGIGGLPHFNPDLDGVGAEPPAAVAELRALVGRARGVLISCPEYAHGVPGAFKNALDWLVSSGELVDKPVLLIHGSTGTFAFAQLVETLTVMSARVLVEESVVSPFARQAIDADGGINDPALASAIATAVQALAEAAARAGG